MKEENKNSSSRVEGSKSTGEGSAVASSRWRKLLARKWVFPAMYMAAAAIILTLMWVYQGSSDQSLTEEEVGLELSGQELGLTDTTPNQPDALAVNANTETMQWPVQNFDEMEIVKPFFESTASNEARQAAMLQYGDTFMPNVGVGLARKDKQSFDVVAAMSGKVIVVENKPLVGNQVVIAHDNGLTTVYQSLTDVQVKKDDQVEKGDLLAKAGRNELEKDLGIHLHFEIRQGQDGAPLNPEQFLAQQ